MTQQEIWFTGSDNYKLYGVLTLPETTSSPPLVIMCHGFGIGASQSKSYKPLARTLTQKGIASFYYDRMGLGKSQGNFARTKHTQDLKDLKISIDTVLNHAKFSSKLAFLGASSGALLAILHTAQDTRIKFLCLKCPEIKPIKFWKNKPGFDKWNKSKPLKYFSESLKKFFNLDYDFYLDLDKLPLSQAINKITIPTFIVHGDKDQKFPLSDSKLLLNKLPSKDKQLQIISGADHWFHGHRREVNQAIINWLIQKLT